MKQLFTLAFVFGLISTVFAQEIRPPYTQDFDTTALCAGECDIPCIVQNEWENVGNRSWNVFTGSTPSELTGPDQDASGDGNYIYVEGSDKCDNDEFILQSPIIDLTDIYCATFNFKRHSEGINVKTLRVKVRRESETDFTTVKKYPRRSTRQKWEQESVDLSEFSNDKIQIRFEYYTGEFPKSDIALDEFEIVIDEEAPVVSCPSDQIVSTNDEDCDAAVILEDATAIDNCGLNVSTFADFPIGDTLIFPVGTQSLNYYAQDGNGNIDTCSITVTVVDNFAPSLENITDRTLNIEPGSCTADLLVNSSDIQDNCSISSLSIEGESININFDTPVELGPGIYNFTVFATDVNGNTDFKNFAVEVVDISVPQVECPSDMDIENEQGLCSAFVTVPDPIAITDNGCDIANLTVMNSLTSNSTIKLEVGVYPVVYTVTDLSGNTAACEFTINVNDTEFPEFIDFPDDIASCDRATRFVEPDIIDNCGASYTASKMVLVDDLFPDDTIQYIVFTGTDLDSNVIKDSVKIEIYSNPRIVIDQITPTTDKRTKNGAIEVSFDGGTSPLFYSWSTGDFSEDIRDLRYGYYSLNVVDSKGCTDQVRIFVPWRYNKGVVSEATAEMISLYPNPASTQLTFDAAVEGVTYQIIDVFGRTVALEGTTSSRLQTIDVSNLSVGHYLVVCQHAEYGITETKKIIIAR